MKKYSSPKQQYLSTPVDGFLTEHDELDHYDQFSKSIR